MEDVAADQAEGTLQVQRGQRLPAEHRVGESGRVALDGGDHQLGDLVAVRVPAAPIRQLRRHVLAEQAGHVLAGRRQPIVQRAGDQQFDDGVARPTVLARIAVGAVHVVQARRQNDAGGEVVARPRQCAEVRQPRQRHVHPERARAAAPLRHAFAGGSRDVRRVEQVLVQQLGVDVGNDAPRVQALAVLGDHADRAPVLDQDLAHAGVGADLRACGERGLGHRLGDRPHAAERMAPGALDPVALAEHVVQQHVGRTWRVRAGVVADDAVEAEQGLDRVALEPTLQVLGGRDAEQVQQFLAQAGTQRMQAAAEAAGTQQFRQRLPPAAVGNVRRRL